MPIAFFDLFGTLASFDPVIDEIRRLVPEIKDHKNFFNMFWFSALRDYMCLAMTSPTYVPLMDIIPYALNRSLEASGYELIPSVQKNIVNAFNILTPRPEAVEAVRILFNRGWTLYCLTTAPKDHAADFLRRGGLLDYFSNARSLPVKELIARGPDCQIISCNDIGKAKPLPELYQLAKAEVFRALKVTVIEPVVYMVAAHSWDVSSARKANFVSVWLSYEEKTSCSGIFGQPDIRADTLTEACEEMLRFEERIVEMRLQRDISGATLLNLALGGNSVAKNPHSLPNSYAAYPTNNGRERSGSNSYSSYNSFVSNSGPGTPVSRSAPGTPVTKSSIRDGTGRPEGLSIRFANGLSTNTNTN